MVWALCLSRYGLSARGWGERFMNIKSALLALDPVGRTMWAIRTRACRRVNPLAWNISRKWRATIPAVVTSKCLVSFVLLELTVSHRKSAWCTRSPRYAFIDALFKPYIDCVNVHTMGRSRRAYIFYLRN